MKRQRRISSSEGGSSPTKSDDGDDDRISVLPDDILFHIVSLLSMREAVCTSILSHRWRDMYAYMPDIEFDWCKTVSANSARRWSTKRLWVKPRKNVCTKFVRHLVIRIDRFLARHLGTKIASFKVSCCLRSKYAYNINDWIDTCVKKGIENLDLAFSCDKLSERNDWKANGYYQFATRLLAQGKESKLRHLSLRSCFLWADFSDRFSTLSTLVLSDVHVVGAEPNMFSSCVKLESLTLLWCFGIEKLCISLDHLKSLTVSKCPGLKGIELSSTKLTTFRCVGNHIDIAFTKVPNLEEVYLLLGGIEVIQTYAKLEKDLPNVKFMAVGKA